MARSRTGSLELRKRIWHARLTVTKPDGSKSRPWFSLETADKGVAKRKLARLNKRLQGGESLDVAALEAASAGTVDEYEVEWHERRKARGVVSARDEHQWYVAYLSPTIGRFPLTDVRPGHFVQALDAAVDACLKRESVKKVR